MKKKTASRRPDLFDVDEHQAAPIPKQRELLATLMGALLREIAAAKGRAAGVWYHRRWMKVMEVPHAPS